MKFEEYFPYHDYDRKHCPVCDHLSHTEWAQEEFFTAVQCKQCSFVYIHPSLNEDGLNYYYSNYIGDRFRNKKKMEDRSLQYKIDASFLHKVISKGNLLDVGCNGGFFLNELSNDFTKYGIEIDADAVKYARNEFGLDVVHGVIGKDSFQESFFDVITFRGVIEHILEPRVALKRAVELLKPGGFIYFCATPNLQSFGADFYREKWNLWHPIEHINIFDAKTLHQLLGMNIFTLHTEDYQYLGTPYEDQSQDYAQLIEDIILKDSGRWDDVKKSKPFWGNMMSLIYQKK